MYYICKGNYNDKFCEASKNFVFSFFKTFNITSMKNQDKDENMTKEELQYFKVRDVGG